MWDKNLHSATNIVIYSASCCCNTLSSQNPDCKSGMNTEIICEAQTLFGFYERRHVIFFWHYHKPSYSVQDRFGPGHGGDRRKMPDPDDTCLWHKSTMSFATKASGTGL